jgi:hypothetical protein
MSVDTFSKLQPESLKKQPYDHVIRWQQSSYTCITEFDSKRDLSQTQRSRKKPKLDRLVEIKLSAVNSVYLLFDSYSSSALALSSSSESLTTHPEICL